MAFGYCRIATSTEQFAIMMQGLDGRRVALAHHWLVSMRGGEKVLLALAEMLPDVPIYTLVANPKRLDSLLARREIRTSFLQRLPGACRWYRSLLPILPAAARSLDVRGFDIVVCSDAAVIKGLRCSEEALKICYCHSPMRYVWDLQGVYRRSFGPLQRWALAGCSGPLRRWDHAAAQTVTAFVANSFHVAERIRRNYGRNAVVIYPPVDVPDQPDFTEPEDFYLVLGQLTAYKRPDLAVRACNELKRRLVIIGEGEQCENLRRLAGPTIELLGYRNDQTVRSYLRRCRALLFCGQEDFGIVPVEAQAAGRPVIAYGVGGAGETVIDGQTGVLFGSPSVRDVVDAILRFEQQADRFASSLCYENARRFSRQAFIRRFSRFLEHSIQLHHRHGTPGVRHELDRAQVEQFLDMNDGGRNDIVR